MGRAVRRGHGGGAVGRLRVLLEVGVFIIDVQGGHDALGDNARPAAAVGGGLSWPLAGQDQLPLFGTAPIDVFAEDFLKEAAPLESGVPDLGQGELGLEHRPIVAVTGPTVFGCVALRTTRGRLGTA